MQLSLAEDCHLTHTRLATLQCNWILSILWWTEHIRSRQSVATVKLWSLFLLMRLFLLMSCFHKCNDEHMQHSGLVALTRKYVTHAHEPTNPSLFERLIQFVHVFHIRFVCFPLSNVHHSWGRLWDNAASKITFQCPISCLSVRMKLPYKHHCASWPSELRSFVRDWAAKSILAFLCQQLCPCMMMSHLPVSACEGERHFYTYNKPSTLTATVLKGVKWFFYTSWPLICSSIKRINGALKCPQFSWLQIADLSESACSFHRHLPKKQGLYLKAWK